MELWLLGAGAIVLIVIAVYVVSRAPEASEATAAPGPGSGLAGAEQPPRSDVVGSRQEVTRMGERMSPDLAPQGAQFEDQYTSATADLSAGGVATARERMQATDLGAARQEPPAAGLASTARMPTTGQPMTTRRVGIGAGAMVALVGAVGSAWLYSRWQRERNRPINRLRRGARAAALRLGERLPETDAMPDAAPIGGLATALLVMALVGARLFRSGGSRTERARKRLREATDVASQTRVVTLPDWQPMLGRLRGVLPLSIEMRSPTGFDIRPPTRFEIRPPKVDQRQARARVQRSMRKAKSAQPRGVLPFGFGGLVAIGAAAYLVWRVFRGQRREERAWYIGEGAARET